MPVTPNVCNMHNHLSCGCLVADLCMISVHMMLESSISLLLCIRTTRYYIILNDLEEYLKLTGARGIFMSQLRVHILLFPDNVLILAESDNDLKRSLDALSEYCKASALRVNTNKTKLFLPGITQEVIAHSSSMVVKYKW